MSTAPHILARGMSSYYDPSLAALAKEREEGKDGSNAAFSEVLDTINPLHHIPGVSTAYRAATGDALSGGARILGGALFGGPIGMVGAIVNSIVAEATGKDLGEHVVAFFTPGTAEAQHVADASGPMDEAMPWLNPDKSFADEPALAQAPAAATEETVAALPVVSVTAADITPVAFTPPQQLAPHMEWQDISTTLPEESITAASPAPREERLPWMDDEPTTPHTLDGLADEHGLAPLPHLTAPVSLPAELPLSAYPQQAYHPYPLQEPAYNAAQAALDINA